MDGTRLGTRAIQPWHCLQRSLVHALLLVIYSAFASAQTTTTEIPPEDVPLERPYPDAISLTLEDIEHLLTSLGILAAGVWAYFNYFRGRTYRPRLEPKVTATVTAQCDACYLAITTSVKNVGLSKVDITQEGTVLTVSAAPPPALVKQAQEFEWIELRYLETLTDHEWIEPGEQIDEQRIVAIPANHYLAFRVEVRLVSKKGTTWSAGAIATREIATTERTGELQFKGSRRSAMENVQYQSDEDRQKTEDIERKKREQEERDRQQGEPTERSQQTGR
jgi:hypothetical protein